MKLDDWSRHKGYYGIVFRAKRDTAYNFGVMPFEIISCPAKDPTIQTSSKVQPYAQGHRMTRQIHESVNTRQKMHAINRPI